MSVFTVEKTEENERLIEALVPYALEGQYSAGLEALDAQLGDEMRMNLTHETARRIQDAQQGADNSEFAQYPVEKVEVGRFVCLLDRVGQKILNDALAIYKNRFTVGVSEACLSQFRYQQVLQNDLKQKKQDAFSVPIVEYAQRKIENVALVPNYKVHSQHFLKGKNCTVVGFSSSLLLLEDDVKTEVKCATKYNFVFPSIINKKQNTNILLYEFVDMVEKSPGLYLYRFYLSPSNAAEKKSALQKYIEKHAHVFPLMLEQEETRTLHSLERDLVVYNSPQVPIFCHRQDSQLEALAALMTEANQQYFPFWRKRDWFPSQEHLNEFAKELFEKGHCIYLIGRVNQEGNRYDVCGSLRELVNLDALNRFVISCDPDSILVMQCHYQKISPEAISETLEHYSPEKSARAIIENVNSVVFCQNITPLLGRLVSAVDPGEIHVPDKFRVKHSQAIEQHIVSDPVNLRKESRFHFEDTFASVYTGKVTKLQAQVLDVSRHGLRLKLLTKRALRLKKHVRVNIKEIKLSRLKYKIVHYDPHSHEIRLKITPKYAYHTAGHLEKLFKENSVIFKERNIFRANKQTFDALFHLNVENHCLPILSLRSGVADYQRLSKLFYAGSADMFVGCEMVEDRINLSDHLSPPNSTNLESPFIHALTQKQRQNVVCLVYENGRIVKLDEEQLGESEYRDKITNQLLTGTCHLKYLTYLPIMAERPMERLQNRNLALLSNLNREVALLAKGSQYDVTHSVIIEDLSAIFTVCLNYNILMK